jgi:uncharacterized protein YndB with AHSA1/START domain
MTQTNHEVALELSHRFAAPRQKVFEAWTNPEVLKRSYTWSWEEGPGAAMQGSENTLVVVDFVEDGDGTLVALRHSGFANEQLRELHRHGCQAVLANLENRVFS